MQNPCRREKCHNYATLQKQIEGLDRTVRDGFKSVNARLGSGDVNFATVGLRLNHLEKIVYGAVGLALLAVGAAVLGMVVRATPPQVQIKIDGEAVKALLQQAKEP
jgi:hypothetical protein